MKDWGIIVAAFVAVYFIVHSVYKSGAIVSTQLDELNAKVDALQDKLDSIESDLESERGNKNYINPVDL